METSRRAFSILSWWWGTWGMLLLGLLAVALHGPCSPGSPLSELLPPVTMLSKVSLRKLWSEWCAFCDPLECARSFSGCIQFLASDFWGDQEGLTANGGKVVVRKHWGLQASSLPLLPSKDPRIQRQGSSPPLCLPLPCTVLGSFPPSDT